MKGGSVGREGRRVGEERGLRRGEGGGGAGAEGRGEGGKACFI